MHAFTATLPETCPSPHAGPPVLVVCGCYPGTRTYYALVGPAQQLLHQPRLERRNLTLAELLRWFMRLGVVWPGGLADYLRRDAQAGQGQPWGCYLWREQGPELLCELPTLSS